MLEGNAAGKSASQPLRATSAAQPKGCSGCSVPRAGTTSHQRNAFPPRNQPHSGTNSPRKALSPRNRPRSGTNPPSPTKEMHFLPKSNPIPGQTLPAPPKKCISSPKPTKIRDKSCIGAGAAMHKKAGLRY